MGTLNVNLTEEMAAFVESELATGDTCRRARSYVKPFACSAGKGSRAQRWRYCRRA